VRKFINTPPILVVIAVIFYLTFSVLLLRVFPPPFPEEACFPLPAHSLFETGHLQTAVVAGLEKYTFWMPPLYFAALGLFFQVFGFNFDTVRLFSVLCGVGVVILISQLGRLVKLPRAFLASCLILVVVDPFFLRYSKLGRMDGFTMIWILGSLTSHLMWVETKDRRWSFIALLSGALAVASHPFGLVAPVGLFLHRFALCRRKSIGPRTLWGPVLSVVAVIALLSLYWTQDCTEFLAQVKFQFARKVDRGVAVSVTNWFSRYRTLPGLLLVDLAAVLFAFGLASRKGWSSSEGAITIFGLLTFIISVLNYELFYPIYYIPFLALLFAVELQEIRSWAPKLLVRWVFVLAIVGVGNATLYDGYFSYLYLFKLRDDTSLEAVSTEVSRLIPAQSRVLLIGAPDLYWGLKPIRSDLSFFEPVVIDSARGDRLAAAVDIVLAMRCFQASFDEFVQEVTKHWEGVLQGKGKRLQLLGTVGREVPFAYRGSVYRVVPILH